MSKTRKKDKYGLCLDEYEKNSNFKKVYKGRASGKYPEMESSKAEAKILESLGAYSDFYGENKENVPELIFKKIRNTLTILYNVGIIYPDITGYNFIHSNNKIWIIDFEHAYFINKEPNKFVEKFLEGCNEWNEEFK